MKMKGIDIKRIEPKKITKRGVKQMTLDERFYQLQIKYERGEEFHEPKSKNITEWNWKW